MDKKTIDALIAEEKVLLGYKPLKMNSKARFKLKGERNEFFLDCQLGETGIFVIYQSTIEDAKQTYQSRFKNKFLIRVDLNGPSHMCVDGNMWSNHIHIYRGDDEFGQPIIEVYKLDEYSATEFKDLSGLNVMLDFFKICNIKFEDGVSIQGVI